MRTLTELTQRESARQGQNIVWILSVRWPDGVAHYAHRNVTLADGALHPTLIGPGQLLSSATDRIPTPAGRHTETRLKIALALDGTESPNLRLRLAATEPEGLEVTWKVLFLDEAATARLSDAPTLFFGVIEKTTVDSLSLEMECIDWLSARGRARFGRELAADDLPEPDSSTQGQVLPWVFGALDEAELLEWRVGRQILLAGEVAPDDTTIVLRSVEGLPRVGVVQIGDERLEYDTIDTENNTLGAPSVPLRRTEPAYHAAGSSARLIPADGFEWLVAGHPCHSVGRLWADEIPVPESEFAVALESWQGETVQKVVLPKWPFQVSYHSNTNTVRFNGLTNPSFWSLLPLSNALNGDLAFDQGGDQTAAELNATNRVLSIKWCGPLKNGAMRYGLIETVRLRVRMAATQLWEPTTHFRVSVHSGQQLEIGARLPRPLPETLQLTIPSHVHLPSENPSGETIAPLRYGPKDFFLDLTDFARNNGGWDLLDGVGGAEFEIRIELETATDPARFFVSDVEIEIGYRARSGVAMARNLSAAVEGVEADGVLLENPADIVKFLLCDPAGLDLDPEQLDLSSFATAFAKLDVLGYRFSNRIDSTQTISAILARLLFESRCWLVASGDRFILCFDEGDSPRRTADLRLDGDTILRANPLRRERDAERNLLRAVHLHYGRDFSGRASAASWRHSLLRDSIVPRDSCRFLGTDRIDRLDWHNQGRPESVADLARALLGRYGFRRERLEITAPLSTIALESGDCVAVDHEWFPLALDQGEVEDLAVTKPHCLTVRAEFAVVGETCWRHDNSTFLRHRASGRLLEFWIGGELVASLRWDGHWRLAGALTENASLYASMNAPIQYNPAHDRVYFGTGGSDVFTPRFALDRGGNLYLTGMLTEDHPRPDIILTQCNAADYTRLAIGIAEATPVLVYEVASESLQLRGTLAENERFY